MTAEGTPLREVFARFGTVFDVGPLTAGNDAVTSLVNSLGGLGRALAGAAIVQGLSSLVSEIRQVGNELSNSSRNLSISTDELQSWRFAATSAGVDAGAFNSELVALRRNAVLASEGNSRASGSFRELGISVRDASGHIRPTGELLSETLESLAGINDPARRTAVSMRLFGSSAASLGPILDRGVDGVRAAHDQLENLGGLLSEETIQAASDLDSQMGALDASMLGLRGRIAVFVLPAITRLTEITTRVVAGFDQLSDHSRILQSTLVALSAVAVATAARSVIAWAAVSGPAIAASAAIVAALGLLILIVEDLWVAVEGGNSVFADLIDSMEETARTGSGMWAIFALGGEFAIDLLTSVVQQMARVASGAATLAGVLAETFGLDGASEELLGMANTLDNFGSRDLGTEGNPEVAAEVSRRRTAAPGSGLLIPDAFEAVLAERDLRGIGAGPAINNSVNIERIDTTGMTPAEVERTVDRAVTGALTREAINSIDTTGGGL